MSVDEAPAGKLKQGKKKEKKAERKKAAKEVAFALQPEFD